MSEIRETGKIANDMDTIRVDLNDQLDDATAKGGINADLEVSNDTSQLESPSLASTTNTPCHCLSPLAASLQTHQLCSALRPLLQDALSSQ